jgi:DnaK suppressor protein
MAQKAKKKTTAPKSTRAPPKKSPAKKKPAPQKAAPKKTVKKAPAKKAVAKKAAPKKVAPKKAIKQAPAKPKSKKGHKPFTKKELAIYRELLQHQLERMQKNLNSLAADNLKRSPSDTTGDISFYSTHMADHGTDNFDRELALNLVSGRQESIYDIEFAIQRIDDGTYGICQACDNPIERPRLKALPFARKCLACQNAAERGRTKYRPFEGATPLRMTADDTAGADQSD